MFFLEFCLCVCTELHPLLRVYILNVTLTRGIKFSCPDVATLFNISDFVLGYVIQRLGIMKALLQQLMFRVFLFEPSSRCISSVSANSQDSDFFQSLSFPCLCFFLSQTAYSY